MLEGRIADTRVLCSQVAGHVGASVTVAGWVHRIRELGGVSFVILRDRTGSVQLVYDQRIEFVTESVVMVSGTVAANEKAPGGVEIAAEETQVLSVADGNLPVQVNGDLSGVGLETVLDHRFLSLRNPRIRGIFEVQATVVQAFGDHLRSEGFTEIKTSKLIGTGTEGGTGLFAVDYFGDQVYLAQSPQFYKQAMVASGLERVFEIGDAYRAEKHDTPRHLNEYVSLDVEMGFITSSDELMELETRILSSVVIVVGERHADVIAEFGVALPQPADLMRIPRITYDEAKQVIGERSGKKVFEINPEGEREVCAWAQEHHGIEAAFVTAFPRKKRPFYTYPAGTQTDSFDLLFRGLEITTGGRRIHEYEMLLETLPKFGMKPEALSDYLQIFKYGCPPHGGFAIGLERLTQQLLGLSNVKEASLFPRDRRRTRP
jgi:nondiscriminating aspartyl-tRNA synthetase